MLKIEGLFPGWQGDTWVTRVTLSLSPSYRRTRRSCAGGKTRCLHRDLPPLGEAMVWKEGAWCPGAVSCGIS